jgi:hypothetical protein
MLYIALLVYLSLGCSLLPSKAQTLDSSCDTGRGQQGGRGCSACKPANINSRNTHVPQMPCRRCYMKPPSLAGIARLRLVDSNCQDSAFALLPLVTPSNVNRDVPWSCYAEMTVSVSSCHLQIVSTGNASPTHPGFGCNWLQLQGSLVTGKTRTSSNIISRRMCNICCPRWDTILHPSFTQSKRCSACLAAAAAAAFLLNSGPYLLLPLWEGLVPY